MMILRKALLIAAAVLAMAVPATAAELTLSFNNLPTLNEATEGLYEGWAIVDGPTFIKSFGGFV